MGFYTGCEIYVNTNGVEVAEVIDNLPVPVISDVTAGEPRLVKKLYIPN